MFTQKYRPQNFNEFIGNESVISGILASYPDWPHTWLIVGPPGIGKTTLARLIAKQLECDYVSELDAGQDRGIDKIRELISRAVHRPLVGKNKAYIIDECQGLTGDAQQALLKITEDTPKHTYFIFCSTDPAKIIKALKERCQQGFIGLQKLTNKEVGIVLKNIIDSEKIELSEKVKEIAKLCIYNADGIPRNAVMSFNKFYRYNSIEDVKKEIEYSGEEESKEFYEMVKALENHKFDEFFMLFNDMQRGNFEGFRISMGNIFKKKVQNALINNNLKKALNDAVILTMFNSPVHNQLGDIELTYRIAAFAGKVGT